MSTVPEAATQQPKGEKSEREIEKERKKQEKLDKLAAKKAKTVATKPANAEKKAAKVIAQVPTFNDETIPGEKKILVDLDNASLKAYNPSAVESSHYAWHEKMGWFEPTYSETGDIKPEGSFVVIEPPPNVTGQLHMGHALSGTLQDIMIRYNRMKGKTVLWLPGVDHAGISTQTVVEKMLMREKQQTRHDVGREKFLDIAMEWKETYHKKISATKRQMGNSVDWSREAFTMDPARREAVSEAFIRLYNDGTIYRANRLVNWDVQLRTAVSNLEVENKEIPGRTKLSVPGYDQKIDFGVMTYFKYAIEGEEGKFLEIATTRPETLLGDSGVAVNPKDERYKNFVGKYAVHPFIPDRRMPIVADDHVESDFGTGVVKITPAHDANDFAIGKRHKLEFINIFNDDGTMNENTGEFKGQKRYVARYEVVKRLKELGLYVKEEDNAMILKLSERSKDVIEPIMKPQWWMAMKPLAAEALRVVKEGEITIFPASEKTKYYRWMEDVDDWCLSRQLWWGHRVPAYYILWTDADPSPFGSEDDLWVAGRSLEEATENANKKFPDRKFKLEQDADVFDTWFSSGLWPFTTLGWPNETKDLAQFYPTSVLMTGWDILFFWCARMIMLGLKLTGKVPFKEVYCHPIVRDSEGRKMSKSLGNVIDPFDVVNGITLEALHEKLKTGNLDQKELARATKYQKSAFPDGIPQCGTDALRFSLAAYSTGVTDIDFDIKVIFAWRKFCNKIYQSAKFVIKSLGDDFKPTAIATPTTLSEKWLMSKLQTTANNMAIALDEKAFGRATSTLHIFWLHDFCDVFIEQVKQTLTDGSEEDKASIRQTLYTAFDALLCLTHPFMPFLTEELWQRIPRRPEDTTQSIVLARYPSFASFADTKAEVNYELILDICRVNRSLLAAYEIAATETHIIVHLQEEEDYTLVKAQQDSIKALTGKSLSNISILSASSSKPKGCVATAISSKVIVYLYVQGHVDIAAEITKANAKLAKANDVRARSEKLLNDPEYIKKVSKDLVEGERKKLEDLETECRSLEEVVGQFEKLQVEEK